MTALKGDRMEKRLLRRAGIMLLAVLLMLALPMPSAAQQETPATVRVGVFKGNGFIGLNENGEMTGVGASFMKQLAQYAHVQYEFVYLTWDECLHALLDGTIDIVTDARRTEEREQLYDFSAQNIGQMQAAIFIPKDRTDVYFNDYAALRDLRVGFQIGSVDRAGYEKWAKNRGFRATTVGYPDVADMILAMEQGEIDAFGSDMYSYEEDLKVAAIFNTAPNYMMAKKGSSIMRRLDIAMAEMLADNPSMLSDEARYLVDRQAFGDMLLTREQAQYIKRHPVLCVAAFPDHKPSSWYDEREQRFKGIAIDMMERLSSVIGIDFAYVPISEDMPIQTLLESGKADLAMPAISAAYQQPGQEQRVTEPLYSTPVAIAIAQEGKNIDDEDFSVAIVSSNQGVMSMLSHYYPHVQIKAYDTTEQCIAAVKRGEADAYANALYELAYHMKRPRNEKLRITYLYNCSIDYCIAVREDAPKELHHVLNSGIEMISKDEADRIIRDYDMGLQYERNLIDVLYANRYRLTLGGFILLLLALSWSWHSRVQKRSMAAIEKEKEEARSANAAKSEFLARMSHDMRTPMNGILGLAKLSEDMEMSQEARNTIQRISASGQFLLSLINDTLEMSKIESGQLKLSESIVDSKALIEETLQMMRDYAAQRHVRVSLRQENAQFGLLRMDKLRMQQVIINILSNAIKFSPEGGEVEMYLETVEKSEGRVSEKLVITDHGVGIDPQFLPKIFDPFEQEKKPAAHERDGTGLGMSIAKRLVDMMGGTIEVQSQKNVGTVVTILLSFEVGSAEEAARQTLDDPLCALLRGKHILLCEDNQINTIVAKGFLRKVGCEVECAADGEMGLRMFQESETDHFDAVLMDIRMPVMDGMQAASEIRSLARADAKKVPIIALTANAFEENKQEYAAVGMDAHISKPIDAPTLFRTLALCMQSKKEAE